MSQSCVSSMEPKTFGKLEYSRLGSFYDNVAEVSSLTTSGPFIDLRVKGNPMAITVYVNGSAHVIQCVPIKDPDPGFEYRRCEGPRWPPL